MNAIAKAVFGVFSAAIISVSTLIGFASDAAATTTSCSGGSGECYNYFNYGGGSGHSVNITITQTTCALSPCVQYNPNWFMYNPNGSENCYGYSKTSSTQTWNCKVSAKGQYEVYLEYSGKTAKITTSVV